MPADTALLPSLSLLMPADTALLPSLSLLMLVDPTALLLFASNFNLI